ncbi:unnamed protein product [Zymoseptoria tritici ST99CH_3D7]|uniref:Uncharacterized protein n=1 Tax=Zymoseptoria tritici (strain ST99CH_3D7) TaxID=1276538 RepID=A0A1X7RT34_ZYMT9|nr:unnamed protein product [Zymoseptoria tritici ST99CH_3D7]
MQGCAKWLLRVVMGNTTFTPDGQDAVQYFAELGFTDIEELHKRATEFASREMPLLAEREKMTVEEKKADDEELWARIQEFDGKVEEGEWFEEEERERMMGEMEEMDGLMSTLLGRADGLDEKNEQAEAETRCLGEGGTASLEDVSSEQEEDQEDKRPNEACAL